MNFCKKIRSFEIPRFFKVYLLELSSERMKIPNAFIAHIGLVLPDKVILRISSGRIWYVKVIKEENDVFFGMGWKEFAKHNSVEHEDFLVFKYHGGNVFDVKLFGKSECEKTERDEVEEILIEVEKDVEEAEEEGCDNESDHDYDYNREEEGTEEEKVEMEDEAEEEDCDDESDHDYDYNEEEDTEEDKVELGEEEDDDGEEEAKSSRKRRGKGNIGELKAHAGFKVGGGFRGNTTVKTEEIDEPEPEGFASLRNPYFFTRVRMWLEHLLLIPKNWLRDHEITLRGRVTYLGPRGRQWSGTVLEWTDGRIFIDGWADFCKANNIRLNDRCICELLPDQRGNVLRVRTVPN